MAAITTNANAIKGYPVNISSPADGDVLTYVAASGDIENKAASGGGGTSSNPKYIIYDGFEAGSSSSALNVRHGTAIIGTGTTITGGSTGANINLGTAAGCAGQIYYRDLSAGDSFDGNVNFGTGFSSWQGTTNSQEMFIGIGLPNIAGSGMTMTNKHIGWYFAYTGSANVAKYTCADGTTQNTGTFTSTGSNDRAFLVKSGTSSIKYYYNGVLKGTLSANIPTGSASQAPICFQADSLSTSSNGVAQAFWAMYTKEAF